MYENRPQGMPTALAAFEVALATASAPCSGKLRPPLTKDDRQSLLQRFTTENHPVVPPELIDLYAWHDGVEPVHGEESRLLGSWRFLPLRDLVAYYEQVWLPNFAEMYDFVGRDRPALEHDRLYLPVFPSASSTSALSVWPSRLPVGYSESDNFSRLSTMGWGHSYEPSKHGPLSLMALIELWTALLVSGGLRWQADGSLHERGYGPLHWTTYRSVHL